MSLTLTMALDRYDRHFPFFDGTVVTPPGTSLRVLQVGQTVSLRDGERRHERMLTSDEYDVCEFSLSSYLMAKDRGLPLTGIPIFPRRLFSPGLFYVREDSTISSPQDLIGRRVGLNSFQTTLSVLARGDLKNEYGVPWEKIVWCVTNPEKIAFKPKPGVTIETLPQGADLGEALEAGTVDAFVHPHPPHSVTSGRVRVRRLWPDVRGEELRYYKKNGYVPIMHVIALRSPFVQKNPQIARTLMNLFEQANKISSGYFDDPNWSRMIWARHSFEEQAHVFGNPWPIGLKANANNLRRFIEYSLDQQLISKALAVEDLFDPSVLDS